jgi:hypothetical protein
LREKAAIMLLIFLISVDIPDGGDEGFKLSAVKSLISFFCANNSFLPAICFPSKFAALQLGCLIIYALPQTRNTHC